MRSIAGAFLACALPIGAIAGDLGPIDKTHVAFNRAAQAMDTDVRAVLKNCSADKARVCSMSVSGNLGALASSSVENHSRARDFTLLFAKNSDPIIFAQSIIIAMVAWSPSADKAERGQAFKVLTSGLKDKKVSQVRLGNVSYKIMPLELAGIWLLVEPD